MMISNSDPSSDVEVHASGSVAIRIRYLGPTNTAGSRFRVWRSDESYQGDPDRLTVPYDYASRDAHVTALEAYLARKGDGWRGQWIVAGANSSEYLAVKVPWNRLMVTAHHCHPKCERCESEQ